MVQEEQSLKEFLLGNYDVVDGELVRKNDYKQWKAGTAVGTVGMRGYKTLSIKGKRYYVHRLIFLMTKGYLPKLLDHIDGDKTNNRPENLREADMVINALNLSGPHKDNELGCLGVLRRKDNGKFSARFRSEHLGCFDTMEEASLAYHKAKSRAIASLT